MQNKADIYLDNASTTALSQEVKEAMQEVMARYYANPSSIHQAGHQIKALIEKHRRILEVLLGSPPGCLFFTSGGTEANNWVIQSRIATSSVQAAISSSLEHSSVREPLNYWRKAYGVDLHWVKHDLKGVLDLSDLERLLIENQGKDPFLAIMHANNELGNLNPIQKISEIAKKQQAWFHADLVQSVGYYPLNLEKIGLSSATMSAHKVHGPKGIGLLYLAPGLALKPLIRGGKQERGMRAGTESLIGIVGLSVAFQQANRLMEQHSKQLKQLKHYMITQLKQHIPAVQFYGLSEELEKSHYKMIHIGLPNVYDQETLLLQLSIEGVHLSSGSACSSGTAKEAHLLKQIAVSEKAPHLRIGLSRYNSMQEVDQMIAILARIGGFSVA